MTRIISGSARGRKLAVPKVGTRPTSDRAREGLFSTLLTLVDLRDARFLDLYAGSGAVGLEALSRGASHATFVESNPQAAQVIRDNASHAHLAGVQVECRPVSAYLGQAPTHAFDVVFLDAPYELAVEADVELLLEKGWVGPESVVCVERATRRSTYAWPSGWEAIRERKYGEGTLWYASPAAGHAVVR